MIYFFDATMSKQSERLTEEEKPDPHMYSLISKKCWNYYCMARSFAILLIFKKYMDKSTLFTDGKDKQRVEQVLQSIYSTNEELLINKKTNDGAV